MSAVADLEQVQVQGRGGADASLQRQRRAEKLGGGTIAATLYTVPVLGCAPAACGADLDVWSSRLADFKISRAVDANLQERFAAVTGDRNPMHMDAVAARRTQAGQPVVHGVHTLLWALEEVARAGNLPGTIARVKVKFLKWVYLHDLATLRLQEAEGDESFRLEVEVLGMTVLSAEIFFGERERRAGDDWSASPEVPRDAALDLSLNDFESRSGEAYVAPAEAVRELFPQLSAQLSAAAVAEIAACSYVVGMEAPGLHSMFSKLDLRFYDATSAEPHAALRYSVTYVDERFRKLRIAVEGRAAEGLLEAFVRVPPVRQASMHLAAQHVQAGEFAEMNALVIGGSRGLGELTAKLIAAGGGTANVTYALGAAEAEKVAGEIRAWGGRAVALPYDVRQPAAEQVRGLPSAPTHLFYFATGTIFRPKLGVLSAAVLTEFLQFYVGGFHDLCVALTAGPCKEKSLCVLYPSTVFLEERPAGMAEYAMAKAAGEQLCADINLYMPELRILVHRFPKLPTDQTAGVLPERETDALEALLPVLRSMKG